MFSKSSEYALRAVLFIAHATAKGKKSSVQQVSEGIDSPQAFTGKVLQKLVKGGVIDSIKGPGGGFSIDTHQARQLTLAKIVSIMEGDSVYTDCGLGLKECSAKDPCPLHDEFVEIRSNLRRMLSTTTVSQLLEEKDWKHSIPQLRR